MLVYEVFDLFHLETVFSALRGVQSVGPRPSILVLRIDSVAILDDHAVRVIAGVIGLCRRSSIRLLLTGATEQARAALENAGVAADLGGVGFCLDLREAHDIVEACSGAYRRANR